MTIQDIRVTIAVTDFLAEEFAAFQSDVVYSDSACFWGKLSAWKFQVPLVVSTSTFAFNQLSSQYMKHSPAEMADMMFGLPKISREMKKLEPLGYPRKGLLALVSSDNDTDSVVYTSKAFQPYAESFSAHICSRVRPCARIFCRLRKRLVRWSISRWERSSTIARISTKTTLQH